MANMFHQLKEDLKYEMAGLGVLAVAVFAIVSLFTVGANPLVLPSAGAGAVGQFFYNSLSIAAGQGKILFPIFLAYIGVKLMTQRAQFAIGRKLAGFTASYMILLTFLHLMLPIGGSDWQAGMEGKGGGVLGASVAILLKTLFGTIGTYVVLIALILAAVLFAFEVSLVQLVGLLFAGLVGWYGRARGALGKFLFTVVEEEELVPKKAVEKKGRRKKTEGPSPAKGSQDIPLVIFDHEKDRPEWLKQIEKPIDKAATESAVPNGSAIIRPATPENPELENRGALLDDRAPLIIQHFDDDEPPKEPSIDDTLVEAKRHRETTMPGLAETAAGDLADRELSAGVSWTGSEGNATENVTAELLDENRESGVPGGTKAKAGTSAASSGLPEYTLPPLSLLHRSLRVKSPRLDHDITENVRILEETLNNFGVRVKVTQVNRGPAITRYEVQPAPGVKVSKITNLADDIALSLAAGAVRIEAPIPGKAAVGIEVPNKEVTAVTFREVLETNEFQQAASKLTIALGKDIAGAPVVTELNRMPHLLIAGATGAGKSVCMNALISSILFKAKPNEVKFLMIDPKMVELTQYNGIPHMIAPVVTDAKKAATALKWIVNEMENRYELFAASGVKDITRYNQFKAIDNPDGPQPALPYVVVLIDELADLMMVAAVDVEDAICRLAQMARAAGIHLVIATQRPSVDVITGIIKANVPSRIAFAVSSQIDSRTILDQAGAEKLLGRGDMLFSPVGSNKPLRVQGCYVSDKEVETVVEFLKTQGLPEYQEGVIKAQEQAEAPEEDDDELFVDAVRVLLDSGQASISMLQRRLRVGYARAARLIDIMEQRGIVGGYEGSKPREILISKVQFEAKYGSAKNTGS
ncbi:ftsk/spoiiie family protein [Heliomicrobium modesticaldum Ice1]|uniref:Ftsk/spoiiie family protein n=1 Tax=Heliobacterium modesticaldum (strain ATCC 51547 / Ice1) TaxID=498761 RepID=B0THT7_HELMI|nr:DNA translocase FtsK [Heliomicrobium modesticaldum]ABZ84870.1 ftsk/spoiiie family protein [Heliomicrobium modesticaldum Ice1]